MRDQKTERATVLDAPEGEVAGKMQPQGNRSMNRSQPTTTPCNTGVTLSLHYPIEEHVGIFH